MKITVASKLMLGFLAVIVVISAIFGVVGVWVIGGRVVSEAQEKVRTDLNAAREICRHDLDGIRNVIRITADRFLIRDALISGKVDQAAKALMAVNEQERFDLLAVTDREGRVLYRAHRPDRSGDNRGDDELVRFVLERKEPVAATVIVPEEELRDESPRLAEGAVIPLVETQRARPRKGTEERRGLLLKAAAPVFDFENRLIGTVYGGVLLNRNYSIVDRIKQIVFENVVYEGHDIGTATIFLDDVRVCTNVLNADGSRAIGTRIAEDVYRQVVEAGQPWIGRAFVVNNWYITAYEPIRDLKDRIVGILYVGILEKKYDDMRRQAILTFLSIALAGALVAAAFAFFISRSITATIRQLVAASSELARGHWDAQVVISSNDEMRDLADQFNAMAAALKARDEQLKERARSTVMESERLAMIGHLAADVAHEINNPLQGIVAYAHLLLEKEGLDPDTQESLRKIVNQADRCTGIIRGLLDFSRQRKPQKIASDLNDVVQECLALLERQALLQNVQVLRQLDGKLPQVVVDPSQMQQVFMNMIVNAAEAMEKGGGRLTVTTRRDPTGRFVEVEFQDTGHGISPENLQKIFDPFFTTRDVGRGTGLGLAISYGIVQEHNGEISVESEIGKGTTFVVRLPLESAEAV